MKTIDLTPTWTGILRALLAAFEEGNGEGRKIALEELTRMAGAADSWNEHCKRMQVTAPDDVRFYHINLDPAIHRELMSAEMLRFPDMYVGIVDEEKGGVFMICERKEGDDTVHLLNKGWRKLPLLFTVEITEEGGTAFIKMKNLQAQIKMLDSGASIEVYPAADGHDLLLHEKVVPFEDGRLGGPSSDEEDGPY